MKNAFLFIIFSFSLTFSLFPFAEENKDIEVSTKKIDRNGIRKVFTDNQKTLQKCYNDALTKDQSLNGKMVLDFAIGSNGVVTYAKNDAKKSQINNDVLNNCIIKNVITWKFPDPPANQTVQVYYPMNFSK